MSNPEVKIRLSLDGAGQVQAGVQGAAASLDKLNQSGAKAGQQAQLTGHQIAQVSAQLQDLFVQIQAGQAPMTALIQQGSQLSAVFGGFGNAARAVASLVTPTVAAITAIGGAAVGLAVAYARGSSEAQEFRKTLILSGNAAGVTANQLMDMSAALKSIGAGTQGRAAEVLNMMAASGLIGAENFSKFAEAALRMERVGGPAAEATAKAFEDLGKAPAAAAAKLNESTNFLTVSLYQQIKALEEQGRTVDAARLAQESYADALNQRSPQMLQNLGYIEKAWLAIKEASKKAADGALGIGRELSAKQQIEDLTSRIAQREQERLNAGVKMSGIYADAEAREIAQMRERLDALQEVVRLEARAASAKGDSAEKTKAGIRWEEEKTKYLTNEQRLQAEILRLQHEGNAAGADALQIAQRIAMVRQQFDTGAGLEAIRRAEDAREEQIKRGINSINALRASGYINERTQIEELSRLELAGFDAKRAGLTAELAYQSKRFNSEKEVEGLRTQLAALAGQRETARLKGVQDVTTAIEKQRKAVEALYEAERQQNRDDADTAYVAESKAREQARLAIDDYVRSVREEGAAITLEAALLGKSRAERELTLEQFRIELDLKKRIDAVNRNLAFSEDQRADERIRLQQAADMAKANAAMRAQMQEMSAAMDAIESTAHRVWTDVANGGQDAFKRIGQTIKASVLDLLYQLTVKKWVLSVTANVLGSITGAGAAGAAGVAGNALNTAATGLNLYNAGATAAGLWGSSAAYGAAIGTTSIGAGSQAAMLAAQTGAFGAEGAAMTAAAAGNVGTSSLISSIGAAAPYLLGALAIAGIAKSLDHSGTPHTGGSSAFSAATGLSTGAGLYGVGSKLGDYSTQTEQLTTQVTQSIVGILDTTASSFGKQAGYSAAAAFADDSSKDGAWGALAIKLGDKVVAGFGVEGNGKWPGKGFADGQAGADQYLSAISNDVRAALNGIGLPEWAKSMLDKLGDAPALDKLAATVAQINAIQSALSSLGKAMPEFAGLTDAAVTSLINSFGGVDNLTAAANSFYENFVPEAERKASSIKQITEELGKVGLTLPATREQYRALVQAQDRNTESGLAAYTALIKLNGAFAALVPATESAGSAIEAVTDQMAEAVQRTVKQLKQRGDELVVELLAAQGDTTGAATLRRQIDLAGLLEGISGAGADAITALYDKNKGIQDKLDALKKAASDQAAADQRASAVASERTSLESRLLQLQGDTAVLRARELAGLDTSNRALLQQIYQLQDQQAAAEKAAQALQVVNSALSSLDGSYASQRVELLTLQGKTSEAEALKRQTELANLTAGMNAADAARVTAAYDRNAALQKEIDSTRAAQQAAEAIARAQEQAAETAARAAQQLKDAWQSATDTLFSEAAKIRGLTTADSPASLAAAKASFAIATGQALAGDQEAVKQLPELARLVVELGKNQAGSQLELDRLRAAVAASLEATGGKLAGTYGLTVPKLATGTNYVPRDMLAFLHEGEAVQPRAFNPAAGGGADVGELVREVKALREQVARLEASGARTASASERTRDVLTTVTENGRAMQTEAAS